MSNLYAVKVTDRENVTHIYILAASSGEEAIKHLRQEFAAGCPPDVFRYEATNYEGIVLTEVREVKENEYGREGNWNLIPCVTCMAWFRGD